MIERVADLLADPRLHLDADDIADVLWLALQIEAIAPDQGVSEQPALADDDDATDPEPPPQPPDTQTDTKTTSQQEKESGNLYPSPGQQQGDTPDDMRGIPFRTPATSAIPAAREIAKALRPLMRRYPSRTQTIFDEQATVQKIADERIAWIGGCRSRVSGLWHIQLQPVRERWFDVELVADVGASMVLWRQSIAEFHHLLLRHGAFRRVRAWSLNTDINEGQPGLHLGLGDTATRQPPRSRQELLAPGGRRLILVVTDCVSPGWHAGLVTDLLSFWGAHHPIALVQVLPEQLWSGSALRVASAIQMQSPGPDVANRRLAYTFQSPMDRLLLRRRAPAQQAIRLPMPVLTLDGDQVAAWTSLVTGTGTTPTSGFLLTSTPGASIPIPDEDEQTADDLSPEHLVDEFREYASPEAFRLAQFLAAAPLSLPVIRLVQRTMMPKARQGHIAEVFLSGLLRRRTPAEADVHPEYVWYDFLIGVREVLRQGLSLYENALVMERVTEYVREHYGTPQDFQALLFDPDAVDGVALDPHLLPFAEVVAGLQEHVGVRDKALPLITDRTAHISPHQSMQDSQYNVADNRNINITLPPPPAPASAPPRPSLAIGHDNDLRALKQRLGIGLNALTPMCVITAIRGWPGVGKTILAARLAHDPDIGERFPDGVLWASLGQEPDLFGELAAWGRALGVPDLKQVRTIDEASALLRGLLRDKRVLIIVDDAWQVEHVTPFNIGGSGCALLVTTRLHKVAREIASTPDDIYILDVLSEADAIELLRTLAPTVVAENEETSRALVNDLEGLPLALQVAGRLLHTDASYGFGVTGLLHEIREGATLISATAPVDRTDVANETTPTVASLISLSTNRLDKETLERFAMLGAFAPKPASFDLTAMQEVWGVEEKDARSTVRTLVERGLLEPASPNQFWMHSIIVQHAKSFLLDD